MLENRGQIPVGSRRSLVSKAVPAESERPDAEEACGERPERKPELAEDVVLEVEDRLAGERLHVRPDVEAEYGGERQYGHRAAHERRGADPSPAELVDQPADEALEHGDDRGERGEGEKEEEHRSPRAAAGHLREHLRQGHEDESGARVHVHAERGARGKDDQSGEERDRRVDGDDPCGLRDERMRPVHVASEDRHATHADREREERLAHRLEARAERMREERPPVGLQVERHALLRAGQRERLDGKHAEKRQQGEHHPFRHALHARAHAARADRAGDGHAREHECGACARRGDQVRERRGRIRPGERGPLRRVARGVTQQPAANGRVVHHQEQVSTENHAAQYPPEAARPSWRERAHRPRDAALRRAPHGQLRRKKREAQKREAHEVHEQESRPSVAPHHERKAPHVPQPDGAPRRQHQEPQSRLQRLAVIWHG